VYCQQQRFRFVVQQFGVGERTGCDHAQHLALHRPFAADFAHLLTNRDRLAVAYQFGQIAFHGMKGHARHRNRLARALATVRQRDVQNARSLVRVVKKQLVKIAHAVEQQRVRMLRLDAQVLGHHGGVWRVGLGCGRHPGESSKPPARARPCGLARRRG